MKKIRVSNLAYSKPESYVVNIEVESHLAGQTGPNGGTGGHEDAEDDNTVAEGNAGEAADDGDILN